jgi:VWFA-related protein
MRGEVTRLLRKLLKVSNLRAEVEGEQLMKRAFTITLLLLVSFILNPLIVQPHHAQQLHQEETLRLKTELVEIDVVVTDKNNRPVADLKREDFLLLEDGKPQQISFFSLMRPNTIAPAERKTSERLSNQSSRPDDLYPEPGRFVFIILDQPHISPDNYPRLRESLLRFITDDLSPRDQVAVIGTKGGMVVFQQAAMNKKVMALAINAFLGGRLDYGHSAGIASAGAQPDLSALDPSIGLISLASGLNLPTPASDSLYEEYQLREGLRSLTSIAKNVSLLPGRKIAILVSEKLPVWLSPKPLSEKSANSPIAFENFSAELQQVIGLSRRGGLVFYTLDPRGLTIPIKTASEVEGKSALGSMTSGEDRIDELYDKMEKELQSHTGLRELAAATGGFPIFNHNDLRIGLQQVLADNEAYYLLGYYPTNAAQDGRFRRIKVTVKDRPDLTVRTRQGYIAPSEKEKREKTKTKQERIKEALASLVPIRNVRVAILQAAAEKDARTGERLLKMIIRIDADSLQFKEAGEKRLASFEVIGFAYDIRGRLVDGFSKTFNLKFKPETYSLALRDGLNLHSQINLKKTGLCSIRVVVIDRETNGIGTASNCIEAQ